MRNVWLSRIHNKKLTALSKEKTKLTIYKVCNVHFEPQCFSNNNILLRNALPTLYIPGYERVEGDCFYREPSVTGRETPPRFIEALTSTPCSVLSSPVGHVKIPQKTYAKRKLFVTQDEIEEPQPKMLRFVHNTHNTDDNLQGNLIYI